MRPHETQRFLDEVDRDDVERAGRANLDDRFGFAPVKGTPPDDDFGFARLAVLLAPDDASSEDDVFEIEDCEVVIFQFFGGVEGYDIVQRTNEVAYSGDGEWWHTRNSTRAFLGCITCPDHPREQAPACGRRLVDRVVIPRF